MLIITMVVFSEPSCTLAKLESYGKQLDFECSEFCFIPFWDRNGDEGS